MHLFETKHEHYIACVLLKVSFPGRIMIVDDVCDIKRMI